MGRRAGLVWLAVMAVVLGVYGLTRTWDQGTWAVPAAEPAQQPSWQATVTRVVQRGSGDVARPCDPRVCTPETPQVICNVRVLTAAPSPAPTTAQPPTPRALEERMSAVSSQCLEAIRRFELATPSVDESTRAQRERENLLRESRSTAEPVP